MAVNDDHIESGSNKLTSLPSINRPLFNKEIFNHYAEYKSYSNSLPIWRKTILMILSCIHGLFPLKVHNENTNSIQSNAGENLTSDKFIKRDEDSEKSKHNAFQYATNHLGRYLLTVFPFIRTLRGYKVKSCLFNDMIAGFTVGIMHVPQGMAYSLLATLPPVYGLYTSFFPSLVYFFFGTSKHVSVGTMAVISLLTGDFLDRVIQQTNFINVQLVNNSTNITSSIKDIDKVRVRYASALALSMGLVQFCMGLFRLGVLIRYFSVPMTSGFTVGVAVRLYKFAGVFTIPRTYYEIFRNIQYVNIPTMLLAGTCITILAVYKDWISPHVRKLSKVPIPVDLIIVILSTIVSYYLDLNGKYNVSIVGKVSKGVEHPEVPNISIMSEYIGDSFITAVIGISVSISLARIFAARFNYTIDTNKELIALGLANTISSFFHTFPACSSLSRSAVLVSAGGRTQVSSLFSCLLLILVLCFIGPLFYAVPTCCLSAIILVALKGMFLEAKDFTTFWKFSVWDSLVWLLTLLCTVLLTVSIILRTQWPKIRTLGQTQSTEIYQDCNHYKNCIQHDKIKIIRYEGNLYYVCAEHFREAVYLQAGVNPVEFHSRVIKCLNKIQSIEETLRCDVSQTADTETHPSGMHLNSSNKVQRSDEGSDDLEIPVSGKARNVNSEGYKTQDHHSQLTGGKNLLHRFLKKKSLTLEEKMKLEAKKYKQIEKLKLINQSLTLKFLIVDCSCWTFMDIVGADELKQVMESYSKLGVTVLLAQMKDSLIHTLQNNKKIGDLTTVYPTVHDAVYDALDKLSKMKVENYDLIKSPNEDVEHTKGIFSFVDVKLSDLSRNSSTASKRA
ncbi:unnamed protein product [Heterobilharzia americana]|nr:unnamed protein product [Heterobilharzia americana]